MKKIYLFRHGETDWNVKNVIQCTKDSELNENGIKQAEKNAEKLKDFGIEIVFSSPLKRAYKTSEILAKKINKKVEINDSLKELNGGDYEGKPKDEVKKLFGNDNYESFFHTKDKGLDLYFPNGETKIEARNRIYKAVLDICEETNYKIIGICSHGFMLREFLRACNFDNDSGLKNCEIIEAEYDEKNKKLKIIRRIKNED